MKTKLFILAAIAALAMPSAHADSAYVSDFAIKAGESKTLELILENETVYKSFQADFEFPEGLGIVCDDSNKPIFTSTSRTASHIVRGSRPQGTGDNHYRIGLVTLGASIAAGEGAIATFTVQASEDFVGEFAIELTDINVGDENYVNYVLDDAVCMVQASMYPLDEALQLDEGTICMITGDLVVAAQIENHVYVTDKSTNSWIRLDLPDAEGMAAGALVRKPIGHVSALATAPALDARSCEYDDASSEEVELQSIDMAHGFEMPQLSEVASFSGYYYDGELRGFRSTGHKGQSLTLDGSYFGNLGLTNGQQCDVIVGVEVKEPWNEPGGNMPRRISPNDYDYSFQNLNGKVIALTPGDIPTGIDDITVESPSDHQRYNVLGQPVGSDYRGIVIEDGKKVLVQ